MTEFPLDRKDRLILANQYRILEKVDPERAAEYQRAQTVLSQGFEFEYATLATWIYPASESMTTEECREVIDILQMFRRLRNCYEQLEDKSGIDLKDVAFSGFDGNNEGKYLAYGEFLNGEGKFEESNVVDSHSGRLGMYRRMLSALEEIGDKYPLEKEDIQNVLAAQVHPSMRT